MYAYITCTGLFITVRKNVKAGEEGLQKQISYGDVGAVMQKSGSREPFEFSGQKHFAELNSNYLQRF